MMCAPVQDPHGHANVIHIVDSFDFRGHLCITFELMSHSLYDFMRFHDFKGLNMQLVHKFAVQLIKTLCFLRSEGIIHCDLKPENILLQNSSYSNLKVRSLKHCSRVFTCCPAHWASTYDLSYCSTMSGDCQHWIQHTLCCPEVHPCSGLALVRSLILQINSMPWHQ